MNVKVQCDSDVSVRRTALDSLRTHAFSATKFVPEIAAKLSDPDTAVRRLAADVLGAMGPVAKPALPRLVEILKDSGEEPEVRFAAQQAGLRIAKPPKNQERD